MIIILIKDHLARYHLIHNGNVFHSVEYTVHGFLDMKNIWRYLH